MPAPKNVSRDYFKIMSREPLGSMAVLQQLAWGGDADEEHARLRLPC